MQNRFSNKLGLMGWLSGGRYGFDRYAYALHRITGLGILLYFLMHIVVTGTRLGGAGKWEQTMAMFDSPFAKIGEFLVFLAFLFHAINGIRLVLVELGFAIGKPCVPAYPYSNSTLRQRPLFVVLMVITAIIMIVGGINFYHVVVR
jgi:succinate dehydrogenase / fumarate reductase, cytochrome b subunit